MSLDSKKYITVSLDENLLNYEHVQQEVTELLQSVDDIELEPIGFTIPGLTVFITSTIEGAYYSNISNIQIEEDGNNKILFQLDFNNIDKIKNEKRFINDLIYCILNKEDKKTNEYTLKMVEA